MSFGLSLLFIGFAIRKVLKSFDLIIPPLPHCNWVYKYLFKEEAIFRLIKMANYS